MSSPISGFLRFVAVLLAVVSPLVYLAEQRLESFYVFDHKHLHELSTQAIAQHGNNTRAIVGHIVDELRARPETTKYISVQEEWVFNNAGGAMGGMYIIHASEFFFLLFFFALQNNALRFATSQLTHTHRRHRVPHHLRHRHRH